MVTVSEDLLCGHGFGQRTSAKGQVPLLTIDRHLAPKPEIPVTRAKLRLQTLVRAISSCPNLLSGRWYQVFPAQAE
jgi:hypothetical protein